jgi:cytochrome c553
MRCRTANAAAALLVGLTLAAGTTSAQQRDRKTGATPAAAGASSPAAKAGAAAYAQRFASLCAACHGANGRSDVPGTPVLAGQHSLYTITQLFMFREGRRANEAMTAVAKTMTDADMRGFADYIGTLPPVAPGAPATPPDAARMGKGQALAQQHKCAFCHGADLSGGQQVPRIGGQHEDYVRTTLKGFHDNTRAGYTRAMSEALSQVPVEDLDVLAYYAARVPVAGGK